MSVRKTFWVIIVATLIAVIIDLPRIPIKFNLGSWQVDTHIAGPDLDLTQYGIPLQRELNVRQGLDLQGGTQVTLELDMSDVDQSDRQAAADAAVSVLENRVNFTGATEAVVQPARAGDSYRVLVELPGVSDTDQAIALIGQTAQLEFREFNEPVVSQNAFPTLENTKPTGLTGNDLKNAVVDTTQNPTSPMVAITFTPEGAQKFGDLTSRLVGQPLPVFLDNVPLAWPNVQTPITDGRAVISGGFTIETAKQLANQLSAGALPVPIEVVEQRTIGATLGQQSVTKSLIAGIIGLILVMLYMVFIYRRLGVVANAALIIYALFLIAAIKWIPITLTLAGIAGIILSIGMAVDANILIFERIREEVRRGSKRRAAMEIGFDRAWPSIRDSNVSTLITCGILYMFGTGTVRGFALTLGLGVLISMVTAVFVTRTFLRVRYGGDQTMKPKKLSTAASRYRSAVRPAAPSQGHA